MANSHVALDVEIPSDVKYIDSVIELATRKCRELHLPPHKCSLNVRVALAEAISNAILRSPTGTHAWPRLTSTLER